MSNQEKITTLLEQFKQGTIPIEEVLKHFNNQETKRVGRPEGISNNALERNREILTWWLILVEHRAKARGDKTKIRLFLSKRFNVELSTIDEIISSFNKIKKAVLFLENKNITPIVRYTNTYKSLNKPEILGAYLVEIVRLIEEGDIEIQEKDGQNTIIIDDILINKINNLKTLKNSRHIIPMINSIPE